MSIPITIRYAYWKKRSWPVEFVPPYEYASCLTTVFSTLRHFLLKAENAGCILQAIGETNLSRNKEEKRKDHYEYLAD